MNQKNLIALKIFFSSILLGLVFITSISCRQSDPHLERPGPNVDSSGTSGPTDETAQNPAPAKPLDSQELGPPILSTNWEDLDNPKSEGWESESFNAEAAQQLNRIGKMLSGDLDATDLAKALAAPEFSGGPLVPKPSVTTFDDGTILVERALDDATSQHKFDGVNGLAQALLDAQSAWVDLKNVHFKFKIYDVESTPTSIMTQQLFKIVGHTAEHTLEQHAVWTTRWTRESPPRLQSIEVADFEQATTRGNAPLFTDCTSAALGANEAYSQQILRGTNHWLQRIPYRSQRPLTSPSSFALGDVNGDGLEDVYLCQEPGIPNLLFVAAPDGTYREVSKKWGVDWIADSRAALLVDLDNDGDQDIVVSIFRHVVIAANQDGHFKIKTVIRTSEDTGAVSAADYDLDGKLDLYVCAYRENEILGNTGDLALYAGGERFVYHDANNGGENILLHNEINSPSEWGFRDTTEEVGMNVNNTRWTFATGWEDFDKDGDQDLYVANDFGRNCLYRNDLKETGEPRFTDVAPISGVEDIASGMAVAWGDINLDGNVDLYVSNMWSSAGNRVMSQNRFNPEAPDEIQKRFQRFAVGNSLFQSNGDSTFAEISQSSGTAMGKWAWSSVFSDMNNDGWEDIFVTNGFVTTEDTGDL